MPWIDQIDEDHAEGELADIYKKIGGTRGKVSNIMKIQSLDPGSMSAHLDLYMNVMFGKRGVSRQQKELIGTVVSSANQCQYCINHHAAALQHYWKDQGKIDGLISAYRIFELPQKDRVMVDYALKLTETPSIVTEKDIKALRSHGFTDEQILNINMITGYFNFVNRLVMGMGVEFNEDEIKGYKY